MKNPNIAKLFAILLLSAILLSACSAAAPAFTDLPAPVGGKYPTAIIDTKIGDTLKSDLQSPLISVSYGETHKGAGAVSMEKTTVLNNSQNGQLIETTWGDIAEGTVKLTETYDPDGNIVEGRITLKLDKGSIFQWFKGCLSCVINQSRVIIGYVAPTPGADPEISYILYMENWGTSSDNILAMGAAGRWDNPSAVFPEYSKWGFWEKSDSTATVIQALYAARDRLQQYNATLKVVDEDSVREIIGRQTGLKVYANGDFIGQIEFTYGNNLGHMPNTEFIGKGSLSRIEFKLNGKCDAISAMSPSFPTSFSTLFVFEDCATADKVEKTDVLVLYDQIRKHQIDGVRFAIYANGYVGNVTDVVFTGSTMSGLLNGKLGLSDIYKLYTKSTSATASTVKIGEGGGVFYSTLGDPTLEELVYARNLLSVMGRGGVDAVGFGYATETMSGNGIEYYLATLIIAKATPDKQLRAFGYDSGLLDRSGFMILP